MGSLPTQSSASLSFLDATAARRSHYALASESPIPDSRLKELVELALSNCPSSFNSQTTRLLLIVKEDHKKLWDTIDAVYKGLLPAKKYEHFHHRAEGFKAAYGTVLFYEDTSTIRKNQEKFLIYEDKFTQWSEQTSAIHQYYLWTAFQSEGLGCNLQHYNPLIDPKLQDLYGLPDGWSLKAQLVFGKPTGDPQKKPMAPVKERMKVFGA